MHFFSRGLFGIAQGCLALNGFNGFNSLAPVFFLFTGGTLGLPAHNDSVRPCFCCNAYGSSMFDMHGMTLENIQWDINEDDMYFNACDRCELIVQINNVAERDDVNGYLRFDARAKGSKGRCLTRDITINGVELKLDDRLEPCDQLHDVGALIDVDRFPLTITFWRTSREDMTRHRNPLFDRELGITPKRSLVVDALHTFHLGILNVWCRIAVWKLIDAHVYGNLGNAAENLKAGVLVMRSRLMNFYTRYPEKVTRVADFTPKMVGTRGDPKMKTKGAETWGVALFLIDELHSHPMPNGNQLYHAGVCLKKIVTIWKQQDWTMQRSAAQDRESACPTSERFEMVDHWNHGWMEIDGIPLIDLRLGAHRS